MKQATRLLLFHLLVLGAGEADSRQHTAYGARNEVSVPAEIQQMLDARSPENPRPLPVGSRPIRTGRRSHVPTPTATDTVIRDDFVCNDDVTGGCRQLNVRIAEDSRGGFVAAWHEFRDGDTDVWFQRFDSLGQPVGVNERLNTDITMGWQGDAATGIGPDGRLLFSWEDRRDIGNSDLFGQRLDQSGGRLGDNFRISDSTAAGDQSYSDLHVNPSGTALVAWDDRRFGITGDIFAQFFSPDGSPLGENLRVNDDAVGLANQYSPAVGGDDSGRFVVAWMDGRGRNAYDWNIFLQRFGPDRNRLGPNVQVTTDESIQWSPRIGVGRSGRTVVVWDDRRTGQLDIYAQVYDETGAPAGPNFRVNDDAGTSDQFAAAAAVNSHDELLVVWTDRRSGDEDVYARRFDRSGSALGPSFVVSDVSTNNQAIPSVAACPDGGYWVAWVDSRSGDYDAYGRRFTRDGTPMAPSFRINDDEASSLQRVSSIGMDSRGWSCVVWEDERNGETDIYRAVFDDAGQTAGPNLK
ncbi:hypothetical protein FJY69_06055, partial [candidate division WOR-3 bacterium]|nr:hypothetical protein [candidate division WOR-3 bacterium]